MELGSSRLLQPAPVLEFTLTLRADAQLDWQFMNFSGARWPPQEIRRFLLRVIQSLPDGPPPNGGTPDLPPTEVEMIPLPSSAPAAVSDGCVPQEVL